MSISVVITCFNEGEDIYQAVQSVLTQTRADLIERIVVIDDGSQPETQAILDRIEGLDPRMLVIRENGNGQSRNRNIAIDACRSDWIAMLDADDVWLPEKIERQWNSAAGKAEVGLIYTKFTLFSDAPEVPSKVPRVNDLTRSGDTEWDYYRFDGPLIPSSVVMRRAVFIAAGRFNEALTVFEETDLFARMARICRFWLIPHPLVQKRVWSGTITSRQDEMLAHHAYVGLLIASRSPRLLPLFTKRLADRTRKLGNVQIRQGRRDAAIRNYRFALSLRPLSPLTLGLLAWASSGLPFIDGRQPGARPSSRIKRSRKHA